MFCNNTKINEFGLSNFYYKEYKNLETHKDKINSCKKFVSKIRKKELTQLNSYIEIKLKIITNEINNIGLRFSYYAILVSVIMLLFNVIITFYGNKIPVLKDTKRNLIQYEMKLGDEIHKNAESRFFSSSSSIIYDEIKNSNFEIFDDYNNVLENLDLINKSIIALDKNVNKSYFTCLGLSLFILLVIIFNRIRIDYLSSVVYFLHCVSSCINKKKSIV